jgi:hypothetical protein
MAASFIVAHNVPRCAAYLSLLHSSCSDLPRRSYRCADKVSAAVISQGKVIQRISEDRAGVEAGAGHSLEASPLARLSYLLPDKFE